MTNEYGNTKNAPLMDVKLVLNGLFHSVKDGLLMFTDTSAEQVFVNNSFCTMFGFECKIFHEGNHMGVLPPDLLKRVRENLPQLFHLANPSEQGSIVLDLNKREAQNIKVALEHGVYESEDGLLHIFIFRDITWLALLEKRKTDAESILRHDIKTYTSNFDQLATLIAMKTQDKDVKELAELIQEAGAKLNELIEKDLDNFMLESGTFSLTLSDCNLNRILSGIVAQYSLAPGHRDIHLHYVYLGEKNGYDFYYKGDCLLLERLFHNLIKNAVEASPEGQHVDVTVQEGADELVFIVDNKGSIPAELQEKFLYQHATSKMDGHGLGVYSARLIAEAHGGRIDFKSSETEGTTLRVILPRPHKTS